ncbi:MAG: autotransporter strand-loop-strand O-heptosyltransferase [Acetobacteraceae bacterium]
MAVPDAGVELHPAPPAEESVLAIQRRHGFVGEEQVFTAAPAIPTQEGPRGIRYDMNDGCRVLLPEGDWRIRLSDLDTGNILFETRTTGAQVNSTKRYYVRFRIEVWEREALIFSHDYSAAGREVLVQMPVRTLGDTIAWFPYVAKFQEQHGCRLTCTMTEKLIPLFRDAYPQIEFVAHADVDVERYYAAYNVCIFYGDDKGIHQPGDYRLVGLRASAAHILGIDPDQPPPKLALPPAPPPFAEPYVCIATQSTTQAKYWNNPDGWNEVIRFLKQAGYRVVCIDQKSVHGHGLVQNRMPHEAEDYTGDRSILERAHWLRHCAFFIGLSSGLSWLAWAAGPPVVLISGMTHPINEFETPYRVINYHACNSCWNDMKLLFNNQDFLWCPRQAGTPRQFECTRLITADAVKSVIRRIPGFGTMAVADGGLRREPSYQG